MDSSSAASALALKIGHRLPDVRKRAIDSLNSKLRNGTTSCGKLAKETSICEELLRVCNEPALITVSYLELLDRFVDCRESFIILHVLGLEDKVRSAADHLVQTGEFRKPFNDLLAKVLSTSRGIEVSSTSSQGGPREEHLASDFDSRLTLTTDRWRKKLHLETDRFKHLPKLLQVKLDADAEQTLFESSFRLEHSNDEFSLVASLQEVSGKICRDYPPQVILQEKGLFDNLLKLLHLKVNEKIFVSAIACLRIVLRGLKESLRLSQCKDLLSNLGEGHKSGQSLHLDNTYPKALCVVPPSEEGAEGPADIVNVPAHVHMALIHLLRLLTEKRAHYMTCEATFCALDLLHRLGEASTNNACFDRCIFEYMTELQKVFERHSLSWATLHDNKAMEGSVEPFKIDVFDQNLVYISVEILNLRPGCEVRKLIPRKVQAYLFKVFNNECIFFLHAWHATRFASDPRPASAPGARVAACAFTRPDEQAVLIEMHGPWRPSA